MYVIIYNILIVYLQKGHYESLGISIPAFTKLASVTSIQDFFGTAKIQRTSPTQLQLSWTPVSMADFGMTAVYSLLWKDKNHDNWIHATTVSTWSTVCIILNFTLNIVAVSYSNI